MTPSELKKEVTYLATSRHGSIPCGAYVRIYDGQIMWATECESGTVAITHCRATFRRIQALREIQALIYRRKAEKVAMK